MSTATFVAVPSPSASSRNLRIFLPETRYEFTRLVRTRSFALSLIGIPVAFYIFSASS